MLQKCPGTPFSVFVLCGECLRRQSHVKDLQKKVDNCGWFSMIFTKTPEEIVLPCEKCETDVSSTSIFPIEDYLKAKNKHIDHLNRPCYFMPNPILGFALIINNTKFDKIPDRLGPGPEQQGEDLAAVLRKIGFEVDLEENLKRDGMKAAICKFLNHSHGKANCALMAIMSHGNSQGIFGTDWDNPMKPIDVQSLKHGLLIHEDLKGKPKVFILDACRGDADQDATNAEIADKAKADKSKANPGVEDEITLCASVEGFKSYYNTLSGSYMIKHVIDVFEEYYQSGTVEDMFTRVAGLVNSESITVKGERYKQTCKKYSTMVKQVKLRCDLPGIDYNS